MHPVIFALRRPRRLRSLRWPRVLWSHVRFLHHRYHQDLEGTPLNKKTASDYRNDLNDSVQELSDRMKTLLLESSKHSLQAFRKSFDEVDARLRVCEQLFVRENS